ncbi:hypothetical protein [Halalkalicoccus tibetensis]|uniref:Tat (Twin-arginine translocation) pathway signal sequence n=1 Tax=Halalkalicoccus tibetensis TaxID=175632 RepID=A0ABD5UXE2_9EURY
MKEGDDEAAGLDESRRRLLRIGGAAAGGLSIVGASKTVGAGGGPLAREGGLPFDGEPGGESHSACGDDGPTEPDASDPDERYRQLLEQGLEMRDANQPNLNYGTIRSVLGDRNGEFDGHLVFFAASDFGEPRVFLPAGLSNRDEALQAILDRVHEQKWRARDSGLRDVRSQLFDEVPGIHQGLAALYRENGSAAYDIDFPWDGAYNFVTIRQAVGLVDWTTNAQEPWLDGLRRTY